MIGVDASKATLCVCAWDEAQAAPRWETSVANTPEGLRALFAQCDPEEPFVVEPTGPYVALLVRGAAAEGRTVLAAPPEQARRFLQSRHPRAKTDVLDARGLAEYGAHTPLRPYRLRDPRLQRLWELLCTRRVLSKAIAALAMQRQVFSEVAPELQTTLVALRTQLKALDRHLAQAGQPLELFRRLQGIPGVGPVTAAALTVRLLGIRFRSPHHFVAYVGLDVRVHDSGLRKGRGRLTKRGDSTLRWLLYLAAQASLRSRQDPYFHTLYERKCQEGFSRTAAICIVARKLAKIAWSLASSGETYRSERVARRETLPAIA